MTAISRRSPWSRDGLMGSDKSTGKFISLILRHKPEAIGITLEVEVDAVSDHKK